ncbi:hypothetical protein GCN78_16970 [Janthinobacterium rivuli]|uniref:hypothetical protein n=1 Tax=Janthinobacterium sp. FT68W TaxID=2654255 RepID=UPI00126457A6|nr:hypothetical protein [Janthinobacterium sp. FT68W]KAB8049583.1 hypothetical protein GCN78_16970 [Janthinobacterium sp. FT68W]
MYNLESLAAAEANLKDWNDKFSNDSSNNPDKHLSQRKSAAREVRMITAELKRLGILEMTEAEKLDAELDRLYPSAQSKSIVTHNGRQYQVTYFPVEKSRSRNSVNEWGHRWTALQKGE